MYGFRVAFMYACFRVAFVYACFRAAFVYACFRVAFMYACFLAWVVQCSHPRTKTSKPKPALHPPYPRTCRATQRNSSLGHPIIAVAGHCCGYKRCRPVGVHDAAEAIRLECDNVGNAHTVWQHRRRHCIVWGDARMLWPEQRELLHPVGTVQLNL